MANTKTLAALRSGSLLRADMAESGFISEAEANAYVNDALSELHDLLVMTYEDHFQTSDNVSLVAGTESYSLPTDFQKLLAVHLVEGGKRFPLRQFSAGEIARYGSDFLSVPAGNASLLYRLSGNKIFFSPKPSAAGTVELWYVPQFAPLTDDADVVSYAICPGWDEYAEVRAAIDCLSKEQSDTSAQERKLARLTDRITKAATKRNAGEPQRIRDVYSNRARRFSRTVRG